MLTRLKHIKSNKVTAKDGTVKVYYYHRKTGKPIQGEPGTPEFLASYQAASAAEHNQYKGTIRGIIIEYKKSHKYEKLKPRTKSDYNGHLDTIGEKWGSVPLAVFEDKRIRKDVIGWRDELAVTSKKQADYAWSVFRLVIQYAVHIGEMSNNHLKNPGRLYTPDRSDNIWLASDVERFLNATYLEMQTALLLALHTGQRKGDLIRLPWTSYNGEGINLRQSKSNRKVYIPITRVLKAHLDSLPRKAITILTNTKGRPWTGDGFNSSWGKAKDKAGITELTFHDLRGTTVTLLAEQGCTSMQIASITGHSLKHVEAIIDQYGARTKKIAQEAIAKFEQSWAGTIGEASTGTQRKQK